MENMKPLALVVDDGYRRVPVMNVAGEEIGAFYFNPTDMGIFERYNKLVEHIDEVFAPMNALEDGDDPTDDSLDAVIETKAKISDVYNELFGADVAGAFFERTHPLSIVENQATGAKELYALHILRVLFEFISGQFDRDKAQVEAEMVKLSEKAKAYANRAQRRRMKK